RRYHHSASVAVLHLTRQTYQLRSSVARKGTEAGQSTLSDILRKHQRLYRSMSAHRSCVSQLWEAFDDEIFFKDSACNDSGDRRNSRERASIRTNHDGKRSAVR